MIKPFKVELIDPDTWKLEPITNNIRIHLDSKGILTVWKHVYDNQQKELIIREVNE